MPPRKKISGGHSTRRGNSSTRREQSLKTDNDRDHAKYGNCCGERISPLGNRILRKPPCPNPICHQQRACDQADHFEVEKMRSRRQVNDKIISARHQRDNSDQPSKLSHLCSASGQIVPDIRDFYQQTYGE